MKTESCKKSWGDFDFKSNSFQQLQDWAGDELIHSFTCCCCCCCVVVVVLVVVAAAAAVVDVVVVAVVVVAGIDDDVVFGFLSSGRW